MKKVLSVLIVCIAVLSLSITAVFADDVLYENTFDSIDDLDASWGFGHLGPQSANKVKDGKLMIGSESGNWVADLVDANYNEVFTNAIYEFEYSTTKLECYAGFALRIPVTQNPGLFGGGRAGVGENDLGYGVTFDMFSSPNPDKIVIAFNNGNMQDSPFVALDIPAGLDVTQTNNIKLKDSGDQIEFSINGTLFATLKLSGLSDGTYTSVEILNASGTSVKTYDDVAILEEGGLGFYQRTNIAFVDNLKITSISDSGETPTQSPSGNPGASTPTPTGGSQNQPGTGDIDVIYIAAAALILGSVLVIFKKKVA